MSLPTIPRDGIFPTVLGLLTLATILSAVLFPLSLSMVPHIIGVIGCLYLFLQNRTLNRPNGAIVFCLLAIATLALLSSLWSVTPAASLSRGLKIGAELFLTLPLFIFLRNMPESISGLIKKYFAVPLIFGAVFLFVELAFNYPILHFFRSIHLSLSSLALNESTTWLFNKHACVLLLLAPFGISFALENGQKYLTALLVILTLAVLGVTASQAAQLAGLVMILACIGAFILPRTTLTIGIIGSMFLFAALPWIADYAYNDFAAKIGNEGWLRQACTSQRLEIWDFIASKIMESPLHGFGVDATRSMTFDAKMVFYKDNGIMHPHNIALQLWIEFGVMGPLLGCGILAVTYNYLRSLPTKELRLPLTVFAGTMVFLLASWSIWSSWLMGLVMVLIGLSVLGKGPRAQQAS